LRITGDILEPTNSTNITVPNGMGINVGNTELIEFASSGLLNQTPGSIIESLWSVCDGSTHVLNSGSYTVQNVTAVQTLSATYADINGSSITYIPPTSATKVVYRFSYSSYWVSGSHSILHHKFFIDGSEVLHARFNRSATYNEQRYTFEWVIGIGGGANSNTGRQAIWNSGKTLKMQARWYGSGNDANLHGTTYWDGGSGNQFSIPIINIIAIR
jgi:hypothetical protein